MSIVPILSLCAIGSGISSLTLPSFLFSYTPRPHGFPRATIPGFCLGAYLFSNPPKGYGVCSKFHSSRGITARMSIPLEQTIGPLLRSRGLKLATAESCTGGLVADRITDVPGASDYFLGGVVAYAYEAKVAILHVSWDTLQIYGAVSKETVIEMARGVRQLLAADIGISVSGIAGPGGGLPDKPLGTTWICLSAPDGDWTRKFLWDGDRRFNKQSSAQAALQLILDYLGNTLKHG
jgi:nicotinamide-nucleotide amidase